ncbi:hypothetical protein RND81_04G021400 [Saponaria officinalis]|uniref:Pre-rRNA-processing protein TSR2 homolog n=1 Tax=Saponaria officinalis TaxID=3572 RepID=A0AAW1LGY9_SAPOF
MAQLSAESIPQFQEGISLTLAHWDALAAGIANGFGTPAQVHDFATSIFNFFHQPNRKESEIIYIDDLEDRLYEGLISLGIVAEDGSIEEVADDLMMMHKECLEGEYRSIQKLRELNRVPIARQIVDDSDEDNDDESMGNDDMMVDSQGSLPNTNPAPVPKNESVSQHRGVDKDGWVTVSSRKSRGRNH